METVQFKTSLHCSGCVSKITPALNAKLGKENWSVDLESPGKLLTIIKNETLPDQAIVMSMNELGYQAEKIS
ncbi:MAG TPA: heavy-metal-associated domain-containing protein [Chryseolinea sp.]|nr:heavy-metal-associated domain-containing protein [Chryseolinea sp.]